ncbi:hypothetical protein SCLCIDRAFT_49381, partial [Scleroderma citrinum Foug A]
FLRHFTTLLTYGGKYDTDSKRVIAATGSIDPGQPVRILIVAQNPHANSPVESIFLKLVQKRHGSLNEVLAEYGPTNPDLIDHIANTWAALSAVNRRATDYVKQLASLEVFFLWRSFRKFTMRFSAD